MASVQSHCLNHGPQRFTVLRSEALHPVRELAEYAGHQIAALFSYPLHSFSPGSCDKLPVHQSGCLPTGRADRSASTTPRSWSASGYSRGRRARAHHPADETASIRSETRVRSREGFWESVEALSRLTFPGESSCSSITSIRH